jgi:hypothetical protein
MPLALLLRRAGLTWKVSLRCVRLTLCTTPGPVRKDFVDAMEGALVKVSDPAEVIAASRRSRISYRGPSGTTFQCVAQRRSFIQSDTCAVTSR